MGLSLPPDFVSFTAMGVFPWLVSYVFIAVKGRLSLVGALMSSEFYPIQYRGCDEASKQKQGMHPTDPPLTPPGHPRSPHTPSPYSFGHLQVTMKNV